MQLRDMTKIYNAGTVTELTLFVPDDVSKENVEELLELLAKSYHMRDNSRETEEREIPDYMWIMAEEAKDLIHIGQELAKQIGEKKICT